VDVFGGAYLLDETTVTNEAGRPIGTSSTAPEAGSWNVTLHCSTVDTPL
jgi:hypothetical protein